MGTPGGLIEGGRWGRCGNLTQMKKLPSKSTSTRNSRSIAGELVADTKSTSARSDSRARRWRPPANPAAVKWASAAVDGERSGDEKRVAGEGKMWLAGEGEEEKEGGEPWSRSWVITLRPGLPSRMKLCPCSGVGAGAGEEFALWAHTCSPLYKTLKTEGSPSARCTCFVAGQPCVFRWVQR